MRIGAGGIVLAGMIMAGAVDAQIVLEKGQPAHLIHAHEVLVHSGGRVAAEGYAGVLDNPFYFDGRYQWPGTYFEGRFNATDIFFETDDNANILRIMVDGQNVGILNRPGQERYHVRGLSKGEHIIRIEKLTETQDSTAAFSGFALNPGDLPLPVSPRTRQIEFIGDSYSAGYGNTSSKRECTEDEIWATTDTQQAFGPLTAKHYDADYQINAYSGIGIVRNYNGVAPKRSMPLLYRSALLEDETIHPYANAKWDPAIVVIALGGNDFSTPVHAGEKWASEDALTNDYIASYVAFVQQVRASHPSARFILMDYGEERVAAALTEIIKRLNAASETRVTSLSTGGGFELTGCDWHLNTADDKRISATLIAYIDAHPELWQAK